MFDLTRTVEMVDEIMHLNRKLVEESLPNIQSDPVGGEHVTAILIFRYIRTEDPLLVLAYGMNRSGMVFKTKPARQYQK